MRVTDLRPLFTIDLQAERDRQGTLPTLDLRLPCAVSLNGAMHDLIIHPDLTCETDDPELWRVVVQDGTVIGVIYPNDPDDQPWNSTIPEEWRGLPGTERLV